MWGACGVLFLWRLSLRMDTLGERLKRSSIFWTVRGANQIIALRCCRRSGKLEDYWEARAAAA